MAGLLRAYNVSLNTAKAWASKKSPSTPDIRFLLRLAEKERVDLNWLLLGEGSVVRERVAGGSEDAVLAAIEGELRISERAEGFADDVWERMRTFQTRDGGYNAILRLAIEGVRPFYRALLIQSQVSREATKLAEDFVYAWDGESRFQSYGTQVALEDFAERLVKRFGLPGKQVDLPGGEVLVQRRGPE